ncbi:MAG: energy-coupling factor transporter transmembrane protein EcfT [Nanoarchaeota archaeon]|nr:energy-coupling factor transporter transmembrane protein EcfT [Nanoarchaeota archaeon]
MFFYKSRSIFSVVPEGIKTVVMLLLVVLAFSLQSPVLLANALGITLFLLLVSQYSIKDFLKLTIYIGSVLSIYYIIFYLFFYSINTGYFVRILAFTLRIYTVFFTFAWYTYTTDLFSILKTLKKLNLPEQIYLSFYIVLRFLPELEYEYNEIRTIQKSRGIYFWKDPMLFIKAHFVPLIQTVIERADELSIAFYLREKNN